MIPTAIPILVKVDDLVIVVILGAEGPIDYPMDPLTYLYLDCAWVYLLSL